MHAIAHIHCWDAEIPMNACSDCMCSGRAGRAQDETSIPDIPEATTPGLFTASDFDLASFKSRLGIGIFQMS